MTFTFKGGLHPEENKITAKVPIEQMTSPDVVSISMSQHIGVPCTPTVKVGDRVLKGQCIGDSDAGLSCPVHSSVSGTVVKIEDRVNFNGTKVKYVIIQNDYEEEFASSVVPFGEITQEVGCEEIVSHIRNCGIAGMGGAVFPTHFKIGSAQGRVDKLIINCCECEPYITANHRLMLESPKDIIGGAEIVMRALKLKKCDIAVEDNKQDAIRKMEREARRHKNIRICTMKTKYPQGDERQLIYALDKIEIPYGKLPADVGRIVINAETSAAISRAFLTGMPLIERIITVTGGVVSPKNLRVPLGTSVSDIIGFCGGYKGTPKKIISGGPMMGQAVWDENTAVSKGTSSLIVMTENEPEMPHGNCIHCGKCVEVCPMRLMPCYLAMFSQNSDIDSLREFDVMSCVECGCCTYRCPAGVPIVQYIRNAKSKVKQSM